MSLTQPDDDILFPFFLEFPFCKATQPTILQSTIQNRNELKSNLLRTSTVKKEKKKTQTRLKKFIECYAKIFVPWNKIYVFIRYRGAILKLKPTLGMCQIQAIFYKIFYLIFSFFSSLKIYLTFNNFLTFFKRVLKVVFFKVLAFVFSFFFIYL